MCEWKNLAIRQQLMISFVSLTCASLLAVMLIGLLYTHILSTQLKSASENALLDQSLDSITTAAEENAQLITGVFERADANFIKIFAIAVADTMRSDYSNEPIANYLDFVNETLDFGGTLAYSERAGDNVSLEATVAFVAGIDTYDQMVAEISHSGLSEIYATPDVGLYFPSLYDTNPDWLSGYIGFEESGLMRQYPASQRDPSGRTYDPRIRPWYTAAMANTGETIYTEPYPDFSGKGWMISLAKTVAHPDTGDILGVASGDMLISTLTDMLSAVKFHESGKLTLFHISEDSSTCQGAASCGIVVADPEYDYDRTTLMLHTELVTPAITQSLWESLANVNAGDTKTTSFDSDGAWIAAHSRLESFGSQYLVVAFVQEHEVTEPVEDVVLEMDNVTKELTTILVLMFIGVTIIITLLIVLMTASIVKPIQRLTDTSKKITENLGSGDLLKHVDMKVFDQEAGLGKETEELNDAARQMVGAISAAQQEARNAGDMSNPFFNTKDKNLWHVGIDQKASEGMSAGFDLYPDLPPPTYEEAHFEAVELTAYPPGYVN